MKIKKILTAVFAGALMAGVCSCGGTNVETQKGDASKQAILVVSFGTSYSETREATIGAVEKEISVSFPDHDVRRAFTSQTIIDKLKERDGLEIDNVTEAMDRLVSDGVGTLIVQPTHVMNGIEYDEMVSMIEPYKDRFESISYGAPMLSSDDDYDKVVDVIAEEIPQLSEPDTAVVLVGHGSEHFANAAYAALSYRFHSKGYENCFVGTVEAFPDIEDIKARVKESGAEKVVLLPFMIVAGDHATNDICGEEEGTWYTEFKNEGYEVTAIKKGLGEYAGLRSLFIDHINDVIADGEDNNE